MDSIIHFALRNTLTACKKLFGENCIFINFETDYEKYSWSNGIGSLSGAIFGRIKYSREDKTIQHSDNLVLKVTPSDSFYQKFSMLSFFNEVLFYTRVLPFFELFGEDIRHLFPTYYDSILHYNVNSDEAVIVFENLQAKGYWPSSRKSFLDYDHLSLMLRKLGQFHAYSYRARKINPNGFYALTRCMMETNWGAFRLIEGLGSSLKRSTEPVLNDPCYYTKRKSIRFMVERCEEIFCAVYTDGDENNHTHVLCHGDYWRNNVLFKYDENGKPIDLKIVDVANWRFASPAIDVTLVLYFNADQEMRDEHWNDLINVYYEALRGTFPSTNVPSKEAIAAELKRTAIVAYFIASYFLPFWIAEDNADLPRAVDIVPEEYKNAVNSDSPIPHELLVEMYAKEGGEIATKALINVLKDIIDRGFL